MQSIDRPYPQTRRAYFPSGARVWVGKWRTCVFALTRFGWPMQIASMIRRWVRHARRRVSCRGGRLLDSSLYWRLLGGIFDHLPRFSLNLDNLSHFTCPLIICHSHGWRWWITAIVSVANYQRACKVWQIIKVQTKTRMVAACLHDSITEQASSVVIQ
jgi:hypothetical protein